MGGTRYHGHAMKKHKGKGSHGGKGMAGTGKRADQKKTWIIKYKKDYFGKKSKQAVKKLKQVNVDELERLSDKAKGEVSLPGYKILGRGEIKKSLTVKADSFSKQAKEKIEKAGGKTVILKAEKIKKEKEGKENEA
jgi:large subunit ribosomal protein L15